MVTSYVGHDEVRSAHRTAISGSVLRNLKILRVFLLAQVPLHEKFITQSAIEDESQYFNDIVQGMSKDSKFVFYKINYDSVFYLFFR